jgi:hypothetical protein
MPSRKFVWDPEHWRFRAEEARTVADQMTHEQARTIRREERPRRKRHSVETSSFCRAALPRPRRPFKTASPHFVPFGLPFCRGCPILDAPKN